LIKWACEVGSSNGFGIVTLRSDNGGNKRPRVTLGCKRSGTYDSRPPKKEIQSKGGRPTGTKKCDCPFRLKGHQQQTTDWELTVVNGRHNHEVKYSEVGPSFLGGLSSSKEKDDDVRPMENLNRLQKDNECHDTTTSQCLRKVESGRSEMQPLLSKLSEYNYIEQHRTFPETDTILDFF
jgi:histone-lysine N-methyltransferase SETD2